MIIEKKSKGKRKNGTNNTNIVEIIKQEGEEKKEELIEVFTKERRQLCRGGERVVDESTVLNDRIEGGTTFTTTTKLPVNG